LKVKTALISVSDKTGIVEFAGELLKLGIKIISTGGTARSIREAGMEVTAIDEVTGFPEILNGRVKTLHPKVHGALLAVRDSEEHMGELRENDIAARGNFCTVDDEGLITDRRAGRITTDKCAELCELLRQIELEGIALFVLPVKDHRFLLVMRGGGLAAELSDTDPQRTGVASNIALATEPHAKHTAHIANTFIDQAKEILARYDLANMILLRGFSKLPHIPSMDEIYKLKPAAIACYPMYKGLARLVGMKVFNADGGIEEELRILTDCYKEHDFFYVHVKETDSAGEDGDFNRKVKLIEEVDSALPQLFDLKPDVVVVTGDHSTPALLKGHSWHPLPILLHSQWCRHDKAKQFSESACASGGLGRFPAVDIMPLAMANALKLTKFGG